MKKTILAALITGLSLASCIAAADSPVWKVYHGSSYLYLGTTVHILSESDYPLPPQFDIAYDDSEVLVVEVDVDRLSEPRVRKRIFERSTYSDGRTLKDYISKSTLMNLSRYCAQRNLSLQKLIQFKPGAVASILSSIELERLAMTGTGVDLHFQQRARRDQKPLRFLDSVQTQFQLSMDMNDGDPDDVINYALHGIFEDAAKLRAIKAAWRDGNLGELRRLAMDPMQKNNPDLYRFLLVERNHDWIPKIEKMLRDEKIELVLFGALHMVGDDGVLELLRARGYRIENLY